MAAHSLGSGKPGLQSCPPAAQVAGYTAVAQVLKGGGEGSSSQDAELKTLKLSTQPAKTEVGQGSGRSAQGPAHQGW